MKAFFLLLILFFLISCGPDWKAEVTSDTKWSGYFGNRTVQGAGFMVVDLPEDDIVCCTVQKETKSGYLKVKIIDDNHSIFSSDGESAETTAEFGVVTVCNK